MATIGLTNPNARRLRHRSTDAERRLWSRLRNRQLGGFKFRRQVTVGPFVADFACVECRVVVEADGGQHGGAHDDRRAEYLQRLGWQVLRLWNNDILANEQGVLQTILTTCVERKDGMPSPYPLPHAGEGI